MKITQTPQLRPAGTVRKKSAASLSGTDFSSFLDVGDAEQADAPPPGVSGVASLGSVLSIQEMPDEELHKKQHINRAGSMLDALENLRHSLLMGAVPEQVLRRLAGFFQGRKQVFPDPALEAVICEIELRTAVELAKLEMAHQRRDAAQIAPQATDG